MRPRVSVLMPTFAHDHFISRAIESLLIQQYHDWELIIVDDGSPDETADVVQPFLADERIHYHRLDTNRGLGAALNRALEQARGQYVAYLPSDDVYYREHLSSLVACLESQPSAIMAFSGIRHHYNRCAEGQIEGEPLQLVQVLHRRTPDRWMERCDLVTDDLERMYWSKLRAHGDVVGTNAITCEWVNHPDQLHKLLRESEGGINTYRQRFDVQYPMRFHSTVGNYIDEVEHYRRFRERPDTPMAPGGLKILLVGELAYNPERVLALEERGHKLYGLWMRDPYWYNTVGPVPFGHVEDLPYPDWQTAIRRLKPDVIYALLNWQAVPFAHHVLTENPGIPFVWHFKEGPFICLEKGTWNELVDLYNRSDGQIYTSPEMREWFHTVLPGLTDRPSLILDGDLPKQEWFTNDRAPRISVGTGEIHTVVPGRPIGMHPWRFKELADQGIHLHFYGDMMQGVWHKWIDTVRGLAPDYLHLHPHVNQDRWVAEFSRYDGGWLHVEPSQNNGDIRRSNWDDLNYPARMAALAAAGLPMLQYDNTGSIYATQTLVRDLDIGLFFRTADDLRAQFDDEARMEHLRHNIWQEREHFTFDFHVDRLIDYFRQVIASRN